MEEFITAFEPKIRNYRENLVFICVGSNKIIGDSFGPMVGTKLKKMITSDKFKILGDMKHPLNKIEISKRLKQIINTKRTIVVIDSAIGTKELFGKVFVKKGQMKIASGVNKNGLILGDITIKAVTGESVYNLEKTPIQLIDNLSEIVSRGIYQALF